MTGALRKTAYQSSTDPYIRADPLLSSHFVGSPCLFIVALRSCSTARSWAIIGSMYETIVTAALFLLSVAAIADSATDVRCREIAFSQSTENKDIESFRSFLDSDARFVGSVVTRGPDEIVTAWQPFFSDDGPAIKWRPQFVEVLEDGALALTRGPYRMIANDPDGNPVEYWGTFNSIWRKNADGDWHVVFDAGNSASTAPDEATQALLELDDDC